MTDASDAVVPDAQVTVSNEKTGAERIIVTNSRGRYTMPLLLPGIYEISIGKAGFQTATFSNVKLNIDQTLRLNVILQIGEAVFQVEVTDFAPLVETETSNLGQVIDRRKVSQLPLNERKFLDFALLVPGAQTSADGSQNSLAGAISVNGAREQSNNFLLDGIDNNARTGVCT